MSDNSFDYYHRELAFLRDEAGKLAKIDPKVATAFQRENYDPDVDRLLQGFALLASRVHQRLDDEFPEIVHALLDHLWPDYLKPLPAGVIVHFTPEPGSLRKVRRIDSGAEIQSRGGRAPRVRFRTTTPVLVAPVQLSSARVERRAGRSGTLRLRFRLDPGVTFDASGIESLRLCLARPLTAISLFEALSRHLESVELITAPKLEGGGPPVALGNRCVKWIGFQRENSLLPLNAHTSFGHALLREFFWFPEKFLLFDIDGLSRARSMGIDSDFEVLFQLRDTAGVPAEAIDERDFKLFATPAVNLFEDDARPQLVEQERSEYVVDPLTGGHPPAEVFSVDEVSCKAARGGVEQVFEPFHALAARETGGAIGGYYRLRRYETVAGDKPRTETRLHLVDRTAESILVRETLSARLTCTNRLEKDDVRPGELTGTTPSVGENVTVKDIGVIRGPYQPPVDGGTLWTAVSLLTLNVKSLANRDALCALLEACDIPAAAGEADARSRREARQRAIRSVDLQRNVIARRGQVYTGQRMRITLEDRHLKGAGEVWFLGTVLSRAINSFASMNSLLSLLIEGIDSKERWQWRPRLGAKTSI